MDDNFHLRSMRREVHKMCQRFIKTCSETLSGAFEPVTVGLSMVHVDTQLETCLRLNENRKGTPHYIPPETISNMSNTFEIPNYEKAKFESCVVTTESSSECSNAFYYSLHRCLFKSLSDYDGKEVVDVPMRTQQELDEERNRTQKSQMHQLDLLTRVYVGVTCRTEPSLAKNANLARKEILKQAKEDIHAFWGNVGGENMDTHFEAIQKEFLQLTTGGNEGKDDKMSDIIQTAHNDFVRNNS